MASRLIALRHLPRHVGSARTFVITPLAKAGAGGAKGVLMVTGASCSVAAACCATYGVSPMALAEGASGGFFDDIKATLGLGGSADKEAAQEDAAEDASAGGEGEAKAEGEASTEGEEVAMPVVELDQETIDELPLMTLEEVRAADGLGSSGPCSQFRRFFAV